MAEPQKVGEEGNWQPGYVVVDGLKQPAGECCVPGEDCCMYPGIPGLDSLGDPLPDPPLYPESDLLDTVKVVLPAEYPGIGGSTITLDKIPISGTWPFGYAYQSADFRWDLAVDYGIWYLTDQEYPFAPTFLNFTSECLIGEYTPEDESGIISVSVEDELLDTYTLTMETGWGYDTPVVVERVSLCKWTGPGPCGSTWELNYVDDDPSGAPIWSISTYLPVDESCDEPYSFVGVKTGSPQNSPVGDYTEVGSSGVHATVS